MKALFPNGLDAELRPIGPTQAAAAVALRERLSELLAVRLRYSINVTLDGYCNHRAIPTDEELHRHAVENLAQANCLCTNCSAFRGTGSFGVPLGIRLAMRGRACKLEG